jgi:two-component system sensor histidine kinase VanS
VLLTVENSGERLTQQTVATLVEPFVRGTERIRTGHAGAGHPGVGLGLAIVKSITEAHGGTLTLAARPDGGLRVIVDLPSAAAGKSYVPEDSAAAEDITFAAGATPERPGLSGTARR